VPRNASKWRATAGFEVFVCPFSSGIEVPSNDVSFDLPVPLVGCEFVEPFAETCELYCGKVRNSRFEILHAHALKIIDKAWDCKSLRPGSPTDPNKSLVEGEQHYWVHMALDRFTGKVIDKQIEVANE
jgi:hypothetical protein